MKEGGGNLEGEAAAVTSGASGERAAVHIVLVEPEIAGNAGAIGRTCVAVGGMLWFVRPLGFFLDDRTLKRAGLDYWEHLRWKVVDSLEEVTAAVGAGRVWLFSAKAARVYTEVEFRRGDVLVFGPESRGLSRGLLERYGERALRIPIQREARSLNLGSAVAVATFEVLRQLSQGGAVGCSHAEPSGREAKPAAMEEGACDQGSGPAGGIDGG